MGGYSSLSPCKCRSKIKHYTCLCAFMFEAIFVICVPWYTIPPQVLHFTESLEHKLTTEHQMNKTSNSPFELCAFNTKSLKMAMLASKQQKKLLPVGLDLVIIGSRV